MSLGTEEAPAATHSPRAQGWLRLHGPRHGPCHKDAMGTIAGDTSIQPGQATGTLGSCCSPPCWLSGAATIYRGTLGHSLNPSNHPHLWSTHIAGIPACPPWSRSAFRAPCNQWGGSRDPPTPQHPLPGAAPRTGSARAGPCLRLDVAWACRRLRQPHHHLGLQWVCAHVCTVP